MLTVSPLLMSVYLIMIYNYGFHRTGYDDTDSVRVVHNCLCLHIVLEDAFNLDISDPRELQQKAKDEVSDEKLRQSTLIVTSIEDCIKPLEEYFKAGYTLLYPHSTSPDEIKFIQEFSKKVLPYFNDRGAIN